MFFFLGENTKGMLILLINQRYVK